MGSLGESFDMLSENEKQEVEKQARKITTGYDSHDAVNHPRHYNTHPSGVECIEIAEHMPYCVGVAIKYLWRAGQKESAIQDLEKAAWYVNREIERLKKLNSET